MDDKHIRNSIDETIYWNTFMINRLKARINQHNKWPELAIDHINKANEELESAKAFVPLPR